MDNTLFFVGNFIATTLLFVKKKQTTTCCKGYIIQAQSGDAELDQRDVFGRQPIAIFKNGRPMEMITGLTSRSKLEEAIKGVIEYAPAKQPFIVQ